MLPSNDLPPASTPAPQTVQACLAITRTIGVDRRDARALLAQALQQSQAWLLAHHDDTPITTAQADRFLDWLRRAASGEPLPYIVGSQGFFGLDLAVSTAVLIPRSDTETLARWALSLLPETAPCHVADLGTGSGALALAIKSLRPLAEVTAIDHSPSALDVARKNGQTLGLQIHWLESDWWSALIGREHTPFDLIVSNPPYIAQDDPHLIALQHEPTTALVSGTDGLDALRTIIDGAPHHLKSGAWLLLEHGHDQAPVVRDLLTGRGFVHVISQQDLGQRWRCSGGQWIAPQCGPQGSRINRHSSPSQVKDSP